MRYIYIAYIPYVILYKVDAFLICHSESNSSVLLLGPS